MIFNTASSIGFGALPGVYYLAHPLQPPIRPCHAIAHETALEILEALPSLLSDVFAHLGIRFANPHIPFCIDNSFRDGDTVISTPLRFVSENRMLAVRIHRIAYRTPMSLQTVQLLAQRSRPDEHTVNVPILEEL
jgi:hypothetical protein